MNHRYINWRAWVLAVAAVHIQLSPEKVRAEPTPIESFFQRPAFSQAALAPNGQRLAFLVAAKGGRTELAVLNLQTMKPNVVGSFKDADVARFRWVNDQRLVFDLRTELTGAGRVEVGHGL